MSETYVEISGLRFRVLDEGDGEPVLLLHGFPDSAALWRYQVPALTAAGFRVVAPDLRGFGESSRPQEVEAYAGDQLVGDVVGIMDDLGLDRAHVVGHDWGAFLAWALATGLPDRIDKLAVLSVGHPSSFLTAGLDQREKSWYFLFFQFAVAEQALRENDWQLLRDWLRHHSELVENWIPSLQRPGALTAALNWYRANTNPESPLDPASFPPARSSTLGLWSSGDNYLTEAQMLGSATFVEGPWRYERIEGASHWMQLDRPDVVNQILVEFLRG